MNRLTRIKALLQKEAVENASHDTEEKVVHRLRFYGNRGTGPGERRSDENGDCQEKSCDYVQNLISVVTGLASKWHLWRSCAAKENRESHAEMQKTGTKIIARIHGLWGRRDPNAPSAPRTA